MLRSRIKNPPTTKSRFLAGPGRLVANAIKNSVILILIMCVLVTAAGCGPVIPATDNLMRPPRAGDSGKDILDALEEDLGMQFTLRYPMRGERRSAVIRVDLNGDGTDEAIVLYHLAGERSRPRIAVMSKDSGWHMAGSVTYSGNNSKNVSEIDRVMFADLDGGGNPEMIVGWAASAGDNCFFSAYRYAEDQIIGIPVPEIYAEYTELCFGDFGGGGRQDLIAAVVDRQTGAAAANVLRYNQESLYLSEICPLDGGAIGVSYAVTGEISPELGAVILGIQQKSGCVVPEILVWDGSAQKLRRLTPEGISHSDENHPADIDGDGFLEAPSDIMFDYYTDIADIEPIYLTTWLKIDISGEFSEAGNRIHFWREQFSLSCPAGWLNTVIPVREKSESDRVIYFYRNNGGTPGEEIFRIRMFSHDAWSALEPLDAVGGFGFREDDSPRFEMLGENSHAVFACMIAERQPADEMNITFEAILASFRVESGF